METSRLLATLPVRHCLFLLIVLSSVQMKAQILNGLIIDTENQPISNAYVLNKSNGTHSHSDESGRFRLTAVNKEDTIVYFTPGICKKKRSCFRH